MATVAETVKDSLVGYAVPSEMSSETRINWLQFAKRDDNGDLYMDREAFVEAVCPPNEDYVSV